jgi:recombination protein RecA
MKKQRKKIDDTMSPVEALQNKYGKEKIGMFADSDLGEIRWGIPTGLITLDMVIGRPGLPAGRVVETYGLESHGKSSFAVQMMAQTQKVGGVVVLCNTESDYEKQRLDKVFNVVTSDVITLYPDHLEQVLDMCEDAAKIVRIRNPFPTPILQVWDSVAQTQAMAEKESRYEDDFMGLHARILSKGMRKFQKTLSATQVSFLAVNQMKQTMNPYGEKWVTFGGKALKFAASLRLKSRRSEKLMSQGSGEAQSLTKQSDPTGILQEFLAEKNKLGAPFRKTEIELNFREGYNEKKDLFRGAVQLGAITLGGAGNAKWHGSRRTYTFKSKEWNDMIDKLGGFDKVYKNLQQKAIAKKFLEPYGD